MGCACAPWGASQCVAIASRGLSHGLNEVGDAPLGAELLVREVFLAHGSPQFTISAPLSGVSSSLRPPCSFGGPSLSLDATDRCTNLRPCLGRSPVRVDCHLARSAMVSGVWVFVGNEPGQNIRRLVFDGLFRPYKKIGRQHPALRASSFFPRLLRPHTLHSTHDHGCVHVDGAPHLPQHLLDRLSSRGASKGCSASPGARSRTPPSSITANVRATGRASGRTPTARSTTRSVQFFSPRTGLRSMPTVPAPTRARRDENRFR